MIGDRIRRAWRALTGGRDELLAARAIEEAGGLRRAVEALAMAQHEESGWTIARRAHESLLREASAIAGPGPMPSASLKERQWELELALEDRGWQRQFALSALEFSRYGIQQLILISRLYSLKNPIIKRAVKIGSFYTFGRGFEIVGEDGSDRTGPQTDPINKAVQRFLDDNRTELGHLGLVEKDQTLRTDGNLFIVFFQRQTDGATKVRTIDATEIIDIVTDPDDVSVPLYYRRQWSAWTFDVSTGVKSQTPRDAWYPSIHNQTPAAAINGITVRREPIYHVKTGGLAKWLFGCPETYATLDWAQAYRRFLENWSAITEALAKFTWAAETKGGPQALQLLSQALSTTLGNSGTSVENNPTPAPASIFASGPGTKLTPIKTAGATTEPEQGRRVLLMAAAAEGLPETFFGDVQVGALATARAMDRPTELQFLERQELWREILQTVCMFALRGDMTAPKGTLREADIEASKVKIRVTFPAVLEHDIKEMVSAIKTAATLDGASLAGTIDIRTVCTLIMNQFDIENPQEIIDAMYPPESYDPEQMTPEEKAELAAQVAQGAPRDDDDAKKKRMEEAAQTLYEAVMRRMKKSAPAGS